MFQREVVPRPEQSELAKRSPDSQPAVVQNRPDPAVPTTRRRMLNRQALWQELTAQLVLANRRHFQTPRRYRAAAEGPVVIPAAVATIAVPDESKPVTPLDAINPDKLWDETTRPP